MDPEQARQAGMAELQKSELHQPFDASVGQAASVNTEHTDGAQNFSSIADLARGASGAPKSADYGSGMSEEDMDYWNGGKAAVTTEASSSANDEKKRSLREIGSQAREAGRTAREAREQHPWIVKAREAGRKAVEGIRLASDVINGLGDENVKQELKGWMGEKVSDAKEASGRAIRSVVDRIDAKRESAWNATTGKLAEIGGAAREWFGNNVNRAKDISKTALKGAAKGTLFVAGLPVAAGMAAGTAAYEGGKKVGEAAIAAERKAMQWGGKFVGAVENQGRMVWQEMKRENAEASLAFQDFLAARADTRAQKKIDAALKATTARENRMAKRDAAFDRVQRLRTAGPELRASAPRAARA